MFILKCKLTNLQKYKSTHHIHDHTIQLIYKIHVIGIYASLRNRVQQRMLCRYLQSVSQAWPQREGRATQPRAPPLLRVLTRAGRAVPSFTGTPPNLLSFFLLSIQLLPRYSLRSFALIRTSRPRLCRAGFLSIKQL